MPSTPQLKDPGEEEWPYKFHFGCGTIYLEHYTNVDAKGTPVRKARKDSLDANYTTIENYYKHDASIDDMPGPRMTIQDVQMVLPDQVTTRLQIKPGRADKIVAIQFLEHLEPRKLLETLAYFWSMLRPEGVLVASVPDLEGAVDMAMSRTKKQREFAHRHIFGSGRDAYSIHNTWFTKKTFTHLLEEMGFRVEPIDNPHFYPAVAVRAWKLPLRMEQREYQDLWNFDAESHKRVLDVGPGDFPFEHATAWFDVVDHPELELPGLVGTSVEHLPYDDHAFDYVYCSHVLEHVDDPILAFDELVRVAPYGYVEVPSVIKDWLFQFGNGHDAWNITGGDGVVVFVRRPESQRLHFARKPGGVYAFNICRSLDMRLTEQQLQMRQNYIDSLRGPMNICLHWTPEQHPTIIVVQDGLMPAVWEGGMYSGQRLLPVDRL